MDTPGFKTILCPVDFGELSDHALRHANLLAGCGHAKVIAAYANWFEAPAYFTAGRVDELQKQFREAFGEAERSLKAFVDSTLGENAGNVETRVVEALPADGIQEIADSTGADLIVMGTHGRSKFRSTGFFGAPFFGRPAGRGRGSSIGTLTRSSDTLIEWACSGTSTASIRASSMS